jgi:acylphosphatase
LSHISITVTGKVQGVFFRASTADKARLLDLSGFVRNQVNGTVYIEVEGSVEGLEALVRWCQAGGPPGAGVSKVEVRQGEVQGYTGFAIQR